jgi:hypothetical protein
VLDGAAVTGGAGAHRRCAAPTPANGAGPEEGICPARLVAVTTHDLSLAELTQPEGSRTRGGFQDVLEDGGIRLQACDGVVQSTNVSGCSPWRHPGAREP